MAPYDAISTQAAADGTTVHLSNTDLIPTGVTAASAAATAIVFVNSDSGEGYITVEGNAGDRNNLSLWHSGDSLIEAVAAVNSKTIVVIHSVGPVILENFIELENVVAVVWAGIPGQESGNGLVDVLYGSTSPNGKLPFTIAKAMTDYGTEVTPGPVDDFTEGLFIDYRHFDQANITPRFEFGFGMCKYFLVTYIQKLFLQGPLKDTDIPSPSPKHTQISPTPPSKPRSPTKQTAHPSSPLAASPPSTI